MVLSHLSTRDLTRSLSVSKQWHMTILSSMELRRILFLEPVPVKEHLEHKPWYKAKRTRYREKCRIQPVIINEPNERSKIIFEPRPVVAPACDLESKVRQGIRGLSLEELKAVSPSTLLFQPPLEDVSVHYGLVQIPDPQGVTFGAIVKGFEKARALAEKILSYEHCFMPEPYSELLDGTRDSISIVTWGALASNANCVKIAREAME